MFIEYLVYKILDISSLSIVDVIQIKSTFEAHYKLQCEYLIDEHIKKGYERKIAMETVTKSHSCDKIQDEAIYQIDDIIYYTCPCNFKHPHFNFLNQAQEAYDKGVLPCGGSLIDQPNNVMEAIQLISNMKQNFKNELELERQRVSKQQ